ncbi:unnamed protein product [Rotaria socialis]|uniref:Fatty acid hydroxylase domain-containing protein n=2 Tax=Rotaria socialis TaxID=392032 RepID=A0A817ZG57_9BILA|nr:unnamed protein product [Rotaria socialis]CAF3392939.1 unnamed protein product [Rotaria socialis]CAF3425960.1 unnamed protein product [Rotaria socialis]CAF3455412.1 unnamed protein product [Rotaria socialis]CAF4185428.1 unnamed protein product [Rotaria socialis]
MLCEISSWSGNNFFLTWMILSLIALVVLIVFSTVIFYHYYVKITFEKWLQKSNPKYPPAVGVRTEIILMLKGLLSATFCPALTLYLMGRQKLHGYCGVGEYGWGYLVISFFIIWLSTDFFEFFYHRMGHTIDTCWNIHKSHHQFFNPTPFAVIADEYLDQFVRALPLLILPALIPVNMDLLFFQFATFFYGYGIYLHWGHEFSYPDAHHPIINTSFQHYLHHAISIKNQPYHTGFYFKIWDQLFGSVYPREKCFCIKCQKEKGQRTHDEFEKLEKPDYSILLNWNFWFNHTLT